MRLTMARKTTLHSTNVLKHQSQLDPFAWTSTRNAPDLEQEEVNPSKSSAGYRKAK